MPAASRTRTAPLADALRRALASDTVNLSTPGHKRSGRLLGEASPLRADLPLMAGIEDQALSQGLLTEAQQRAALAWSADWARFSVGGSSLPNQALALTLSRPDEAIVVSRASHKSVYAGLMLSGADVRWVSPRVDADTGVAVGIAPTDLAHALSLSPGATAVWLSEPSYLGLMSKLPELAEIAHRADVPLLVDQAWAAHFGWHPELPAGAIEQGADCVVTSLHKALTAALQGGLLLAHGDRIDRERLGQTFEALMTTSASGSILASIDDARALMQNEGQQLLDRALELAEHLRAGVRRIGLPLLDEIIGQRSSLGSVDPLKPVIFTGHIGINALDVERTLRENGIQLLMADEALLVPLLTVASTEDDVARFLDALERALPTAGPRMSARVASVVWRVTPEPAVSLRHAFFAEHECVPVRRAVGRVSAELIAPYPPGIPVFAPGEVITAGLLNDVRDGLAAGSRLLGPTDPTLETIRVLAR